MKILLCMLSEQHVPNLLSVHHLKPDRLFLVESAKMKRMNASSNFLDALKAGGLNYEGRFEILPLENASEFTSIRRCLEDAFRICPDWRWTVNLTGGTKPMSIVAYEFFKERDARLIYIELSRPDQMLDVTSGKLETCGHRLSIREFVTGYGFALQKDELKVTEGEERARKWWKAALSIAKTIPDGRLLEVDRDHWKRGRKKGLDIAPGELRPSSSEVQDAISTCFELEKTDSGLVGRAGEHAIQFLTGGWLEVFLWFILDRHREILGLSDLRLGIVIEARGKSAPNELDICFIRKHALCAIECKSGTQQHDKEADALYKVEAVIRQFRALRVKSYLATTSPDVLNELGELKPGVANRAGAYGCTVLTTRDIDMLARWHHDARRVEKILFDKEAVDA
jgi:hypothetical protein